MPSILNATTTNGLVTSADNSGSLQLQTNNGTTAVTIDTSQNVGIGITTPQQTLHVNNSSSPRIKLTNATTGTGASDGSEISIFDADNSLRIINRESANILFGTADTERMRITSGGSVLIGTTTALPGYGNTDTGVSIVSTNPSCFSIARTDFVQVLNNNTSDAGTFYLINFRTNNGNRGSITSNGTGVTYGTMSDYRLKENISPMTGALDKVALLKPVTYKWKENGSDGQGFIAHELQTVVPECVVGEKDAVNEDGSIKPQSVDTSFLVATLTAAIQELKAELDSVKAELNTLKNPPVEGTE